MEPLEIIFTIVAIIFLLYYLSTSSHNFWKTQGVLGPKPIPLFGNFKRTIFKEISVGDFIKNYYDQYESESMFGLYFNNTPILILKDLELIKDILIKDFNKFAERDMTVHEKIEPLSQNLVALGSEKWRPLRKKLTPVFTSGKLKEMFHLLIETSEHLDDYLNKIIKKEEIIECRLLTTKFTMNVIGSCAFGVDINALADEQNEFVKMGRKIFAFNFWRMLRSNIKELTPWLYNYLGIFMKRTEMADFFTKFIADTMEYRKKHKIIRHDFVDLLKQLKETSDIDNFELTDGLIAAQAVTFFAAGFETSSTTMSNALYELALNTNIQNQLRKEIDEESKKLTNGKFTYDSIKDMKYLNKVFQETLRKYPPGTRLRRRCLKNYKFSGTNVTIPKGVSVWIPVYSVHRDPKYYPKPELFDPERFESDAINARHPMAFLPFGEGPRNCIGARFAMFQTKMGLVKIIQNYRVDVCDKTPIPYVNSPKSELLAPATGLYLKFSKVHR